jgi:hypothetical protein
MVNQAREWIDDRIGVTEQPNLIKLTFQSFRRWLLAAIPTINAR